VSSASKQAWRKRVGVENNTRRNFKDLEEMLRSAKTLKRNNDFGASHGLPKDSVANVKSSPWTKISLLSGLRNSRAQAGVTAFRNRRCA
jgi:hypothetical protein